MYFTIINIDFILDYEDFYSSLKQRFGNVKYFNLSIGAIGMIGKECKDFYGFVDEEIELNYH